MNALSSPANQCSCFSARNARTCNRRECPSVATNTNALIFAPPISTRRSPKSARRRLESRRRQRLRLQRLAIGLHRTLQCSPADRHAFLGQQVLAHDIRIAAMPNEPLAQPNLKAIKQSRVNAVRHGLTAETVIGSLEDTEDYKAFEAAIIADYDVETAVARELVLRLASLLWRLRRADAIEADLFEIQAEALGERRCAVPSFTKPPDKSIDTAPTGGQEAGEWQKPNSDQLIDGYKTSIRPLTHSFLRLANLDSRLKYIYGSQPPSAGT